MTSRQNAKWPSPVINFSFFNAPCLVKGKTDGTEWNICVDVTNALIGPSRFVRIHCVFFWIIKREHRIIPSSENREVAWQKKGPFFGHKMSRISRTTERILIIQKALFTKSWDLSDWVISVIIWETWNFGLLMLTLVNGLNGSILLSDTVSIWQINTTTWAVANVAATIGWRLGRRGYFPRSIYQRCTHSIGQLAH